MGNATCLQGKEIKQTMPFIEYFRDGLTSIVVDNPPETFTICRPLQPSSMDVIVGRT